MHDETLWWGDRSGRRKGARAATLLATSLLGLSLRGCSSSPKDEPFDGVRDCSAFAVSQELTPEQQRGIDAAASKLNDFVGRVAMRLSPARGGETSCVIEHAVWPIRIEGYDGWAFTGRFDRNAGRVLLSDACGADDTCWQSLVMHELGHAVGMEHVARGPAVMVASGPKPAEYSDIDRVECERIGLCVDAIR